MPDDTAHCDRCGWPLAVTMEEGCIVGNCSMRPLPPKQAAPSDTPLEAALREYCKEAPSDALACDALTVILELQERVAELTDALADMVNQHCQQPLDGTYHDQGLSANEDAIALLVRLGRMEPFGGLFVWTAREEGAGG